MHRWCLCLLVFCLLAPARSEPLRLLPGDRGYGLTVFKGTHIEKFPVVVLGTARGALNGEDMLIVRLERTPLNRFNTGILAGMSGSPIYIHGQLVGALSYGWSGSQDPIGGVTPLPSMMVALGQQTPSAIRFEGPASGEVTLKKLASPLLVQGFGERAVGFLQDDLQPLALKARPTLRNRPRVTGIPTLRPGSAVGVQLMTGDFEVASTGTLSWREGNRVLAFGHSLADLGEVSLPLSASYINTIHPSYQRPFKMAQQLGVVGAITQDRFFAVGGELHTVAPMAPVELQVRGGLRPHKYLFKVAQHPRLTPRLVSGALVEAVAAGLSSKEASSARLRAVVEIEDFPRPIELEASASGVDLDLALGTRLLAMLNPLVNNSKTPTKLVNCRLELELKSRAKSAEITSLTVDKDKYLPGEVVKAQVHLSVHHGEQRVIPVELPLPEDLKKGTLRLVASGGERYPYALKKIGAEDQGDYDLDTAVHRLENWPTGNELRLSLTTTAQDLIVAGRRWPGLPDHWHQALLATGAGRAPATRALHEATRELDLELKNYQAVSFQLETPAAVKASPLFPAKKSAASKSKPSPSSELVKLPGGGYRWHLREAKTFLQGELQQGLLTDDGQLRPGPVLLPLDNVPGEKVTSLLGVERQLFSGWTGGKVRRRQGDSNSTLLETHQAAVTAMAQAGEELWIGTSIAGSVLRTKNGEILERFSLKSNYVWGLLAWKEDILAACGQPAHLYRLRPGRPPQILWTAPDAHLSALLGRDERLLLATAPRAQLYSFHPQGEPELVSSVNLEGLAGLADQEGSAELVLAGDSLVHSGGHLQLPGTAIALSTTAGGNTWVATTAGLVGLRPKLERWQLASQRVFTRLTQSDGHLYAGGEELWEITPAGPARYLSPVIDAGKGQQFASVRWSGSAEHQATVKVRTGPGRHPDTAWSEWSTLVQPDGSAVTSPQNRYAQLQLEVEKGSLESVDISYHPITEVPQVEFLSPLGGERWHGVQLVKWKTSDDSLSCSLEMSTDGGKSWKTLLKPGPSRQLRLRSTKHGPAQLRLTLYRGETPVLSRVSKRFFVINEPPTLHWIEGGRGVARAASPAAIVMVRYRQGRGRWLEATPADGLFDGPREEFLIPLPSGTSIELEVIDESGQKLTKTRTL